MSLLTAIYSLTGKLLLSIFLGTLALLSTLLPGTPRLAPPPEKGRAIATTAAQTQATTTQAATLTQKPEAKKAQSASPVPTQKVTVLTPPPPPAPTNASIDVNAVARPSIVNILCTTRYGGVISPITASGVFIDSRGVILANAHVGQYLLLKDYPMPNFVECVARTGSPAYPRYKLGLLYISPQWVRDNAPQIKSTEPVGTGENDFALLYVTAPTNPSDQLPAQFPATSLDTSENAFTVGATMLVAAYPAGFLGAETILRDLYVSSAYTTIKEVFTFDTSTIDVISIGGSVVAQKGSSGGGVFSSKGDLVGIVSTSSDGPTTDIRDLHAITLAHINRSLIAGSGTSLRGMLSADIAVQAATFQATVAPTLTKLLTDQLPQ